MVNEALRLSGKDLDMFMFGNLLPDVNMGWIIEPDVKLRQADTHFDAVGQDYFWAPRRFYEEYEAEIKAKKPLFLGYLFHIWLDVSFMTDFVSKVPMSDMVSRHYKVRESKWKDCGLFIKDYHFTLSDEYIYEICEASKSIAEIKISENDLKKVADNINNTCSEFAGEEYTVYKPSELKRFYESVSADFISWISTIKD